ncbi:hypothetical protein AMS68_001367 [Peltaster fructicola]|uniref:Uncharacterized protein n=1 Tax=Peltaster fructicola TaxID=286661 RepID=A0A6H0XMX9_9PEZI|nr:hypothetical protein AMS68_001367 [Peltaster fructicola]
MASNFIGGGVWSPVEDSTQPHTAVSEIPAPVEAAKPPASNAGTDDPTGGIPKGAGGLSGTAAIGSPVPADADRQTVVGSVLEYAFGKKERTAEEVDAAAPTSATVTAGSQNTAAPTTTTTQSSGTYLGALAAAGGAAVASIIPGMAATTGAEPHAATTTSTATEPVDRSVTSATATEPIGGASTTAEPVAASTTPADVKSTTAVTDDKPITDKSTSATEDKTLGEKAAETAESAKASASEAANSAANTASAAGESVKEAVTGEDKKGEEAKSEESHDRPKQVSDHEAATRENKDAIPTAGGEKLGAAHAGESKVIPDVPPKTDETTVSSEAGQPDSTTADNTAKNAGEGHHNPLAGLGGKKSDNGSSSGDKPKFMDRLKNKLHIGEKKDKA